MGSEEVLENSTLMDVSMSSCNGTLVQHTNGIEESENLGADLLKDVDLCWEDIEDRLTVSRMVSDSVLKGMVSAVVQEAVQKIAQKELELARLKEELHLYHLGADEHESVCSGMCQEQKYRKNGVYSTHSDTFVEQAMLQESLENLKIAVKGKLKKVKKEIHKVKGSCSMRRNSASEIVGLSGILPAKVPDKWSDVDRMLGDLGAALDSFYKHTDDMVRFSKLSLFEWQQEKEFQAEIEGLVIQNCIRGLQEEFEQSLWDQNTQFFGNVSASWLEKVKELSRLRQELDAIAKSLFVSESGQLISHGSLEHRSLQTEMTKMKRHHESEVQEMTEEIFSLKREYLKERGSSLPVRKDKDLDILRKKIPEVILKLDDILIENEKVPSVSNNAESLDNMKDRLESLRLENHELRDMLAQKKREIKLLSSQVSDATEKMSQHSLTERKKKLDQDIHLLTATIQEKDKLVRESTDALEKEKENLELASRELGNLRAQTSQQRLLISQNSEESEIIKHDLLEALDKNKLCAEEISKLQEKIQLVTENLREATEEKSMLLAVSQEKQSLVEARETEHREQLDSIVVLVNGLSRAVTDFESRATKEIKRSSLRRLVYLREWDFLYKQKLESRGSDLQKAEAEVDLLGDEVENLLSLLEKIYIALDHYSPILIHYSGKERDAVSPLAFGGASQTPATRGEATLENLVFVIQVPTFLVLDC
ncbi:hypothetical protein NC652_028647 [Populus alba x Populus x berolinensis]|nr:hypothetical protein NC652_028647 [Populus alba x Populus x berolinensis]